MTVTPVNDPPTITSTPTTAATEGVAYAYDVESTGQDPGDTLTFSLNVSPSGMTINAMLYSMRCLPTIGPPFPNKWLPRFEVYLLHFRGLAGVRRQRMAGKGLASSRWLDQPEDRSSATLAGRCGLVVRWSGLAVGPRVWMLMPNFMVKEAYDPSFRAGYTGANCTLETAEDKRAPGYLAPTNVALSSLVNLVSAGLSHHDGQH